MGYCLEAENRPSVVAGVDARPRAASAALARMPGMRDTVRASVQNRLGRVKLHPIPSFATEPPESRQKPMRNSTLRLLASLMLATVALLPGLACNRSTSDRDLVYKRPSELVELANTAGGAFGSKGLPKVLWLDPRTPAEFAAGRVPQATSIPFPDIERTHEVTCRGFDMYIVYDTNYDDVMAKAAAKRLIELGYEPVYAMLGGLKAWEADGLPVKREPKTE